MTTGWRQVANQSHVPPVGRSFSTEVCRKGCVQSKRAWEWKVSWAAVRRKENRQLSSRLFIFFWFRGFWCALKERAADCTTRHYLYYQLFLERLDLTSCSKWMWKRVKSLTHNRRNVSNSGCAEPASVEMSSLCALDRPAPPKRPGAERVWWVPVRFSVIIIPFIHPHDAFGGLLSAVHSIHTWIQPVSFGTVFLGTVCGVLVDLLLCKDSSSHPSWIFPPTHLYFTLLVNVNKQCPRSVYHLLTSPLM